MCLCPISIRRPGVEPVLETKHSRLLLQSLWSTVTTRYGLGTLTYDKAGQIATLQKGSGPDA